MHKSTATPYTNSTEYSKDTSTNPDPTDCYLLFETFDVLAEDVYIDDILNFLKKLNNFILPVRFSGKTSTGHKSLLPEWSRRERAPPKIVINSLLRN